MGLTSAQIQFLVDAKNAAFAAEHPFPGAAAAEAAHESGWGQSTSAKDHNNLLGIKPPSWWKGGTFNAPTQEFFNGKMNDVPSGWAGFDSWKECFECQVFILHRNPSYRIAMAATNGASYIIAVSKAWATDPQRGPNILRIYNAHQDILADPPKVEVNDDPQ